MRWHWLISPFFSFLFRYKNNELRPGSKGRAGQGFPLLPFLLYHNYICIVLMLYKYMKDDDEKCYVVCRFDKFFSFSFSFFEKNRRALVVM